MMRFTSLLAAAALWSGAAMAASLAPGASFVVLDDVDGAGPGSTLIARPELGGAPIATASDSATIKRDGFVDGVGVVKDLHQVTSGIDMKVLNGPSGMIFKLDFNVASVSIAGDNAALGFRVSGFSGWNVDVDYLKGDALYPFLVKRSADGDHIDFEAYRSNLLFSSTGSVFLSTNAPSHRLDATGATKVLVHSFGEYDLALTGLAAPASTTAPVPGPAAGWLLASALAALAGARTARRRL